MPFTSTISKQQLNMHLNALKTLEQKIANYYGDVEVKDERIFKLIDYNHNGYHAPIVALATIGDETALYSPEWLTEKDLVIYSYLLRDADSDDHIVVFSQKDYDAVKQYLYGKEVDVKLLT